jgi:hypothetical protein
VRLQEHRRRGGVAAPPERQHEQSPARARPERDAPGRQGPERAAG